MKEQLKLLEELQRHDAKIQELDRARKAIPDKVASLRSDLRRVEDMLTREREELADHDRWRREREEELRQRADQLAKAKAKLGQVKTSKEYSLGQNEMEASRKMAAETEVSLAQANEAADAKRKTIAAHEGDVEAMREVVRREEVDAEKQGAAIGAQIESLRGAREMAAKAVRPDALKKYNAIHMRRGLAVVSVKDGTCSGCRMRIPPQLFNILQRGNSLEICPTCNRIIYWSRLLEETDGKPSEPTEKQPR